MHVFRIINGRVAASKSPAVCRLVFLESIGQEILQALRVTRHICPNAKRVRALRPVARLWIYIAVPSSQFHPRTIHSQHSVGISSKPTRLLTFRDIYISTKVSETILFETMELQMIRATYASQDNLERFLAGIFGEGRAEVSVSAPLHRVR